MAFRKAILLAGDANLWGHLAHSFFARDGFVLLRAGDGAKAFSMVEEHDPVLAVIDLDLSGMAECCLRIKADPVLRATPILLLCQGAWEKTEACPRAAADGVLEKPLDQQGLLAAARQLMCIPERDRPRQAVNLPAICSSDGAPSQPGKVLNLSPGGIFFATDRLFPVDTCLLVQLDLPGGEMLSCHGRVAWVNHPEWVKKPDLPNGMGVQFLELGAAERQALTDFVDARENDGPAVPQAPAAGYNSSHARK